MYASTSVVSTEGHQHCTLSLVPRPSPAPYCKQSKPGAGEGLGMRLGSSPPTSTSRLLGLIHVIGVVRHCPPTSTSRRPDVIHVIGVPRPSPFFAALPLPCIILNTNQRTKNAGGLGTRLLHSGNSPSLSMSTSLIFVKLKFMVYGSKHANKHVCATQCQARPKSLGMGTCTRIGEPFVPSCLNCKQPWVFAHAIQ